MDKSIHQDDAWHMAKGVINVARSTTFKLVHRGSWSSGVTVAKEDIPEQGSTIKQ